MEYLYFTIVLLLGELLGLIVFGLLKKFLGPAKDSPTWKGTAVKGILERLTLFIGLLHGFPQIIIAFGALKLGTRLHKEKGSEISNTYFLSGNLISILMAMIYAIVTKELWRIYL